MVTEYRVRRNIFVNDLNRIGLPCHVPEGAFYAFPSVKETGLSDFEFAGTAPERRTGSSCSRNCVRGCSERPFAGVPMLSHRKDLKEAVSQDGTFHFNPSYNWKDTH